MSERFDFAKAERAVLQLLEAVGEDPGRDGLQATPRRVARMYSEILSGLSEDPRSHLSVTFEADHDEMVALTGITIHSVCEHHLLPWIGNAHVSYIPNDEGRVTGLSKLARLVDGYARRPQVQERFTSQVADAIDEVLEPRGVLVVVEAEHLCMSMRGVSKPGALTITSAVRGILRSDAAARSEAFSVIRGRTRG